MTNPDELLAKIRHLTNRVIPWVNSYDEYKAAAEELAATVAALDSYLSSTRDLPRAWRGPTYDEVASSDRCQ
jgi:hypothetical protein